MIRLWSRTHPTERRHIVALQISAFAWLALWFGVPDAPWWAWGILIGITSHVYSRTIQWAVRAIDGNI